MESLFHLLIALQVFVKGWDKAEHFHLYPLRVIFLFLASALLFASVIFHHALEKRFRNFDGFFHFFEGLVLITVATILWEEGKWRIPVFLFFIGGTYLFIGLTQLLTKNPDREAVRLRLQIVLGILFLTAAAATVAWNVLKGHNVWLFMTAAILAIAGTANLRLRYVFIRKKGRETESNRP